VRPRSADRNTDRGPYANSVVPARSTPPIRARATSRPPAAENVSPPSVERRRPVGPASTTTFGLVATTARAFAVVPVSSGRHVVPPSRVRNRPPAVSSAKPSSFVRNETSSTSSEVDTLPRTHVRPPSDRRGQRAVLAGRERRPGPAAGAHPQESAAEAPSDRGERAARVVGHRGGAGRAAHDDARGRGERRGGDRVGRRRDQPHDAVDAHELRAAPRGREAQVGARAADRAEVRDAGAQVLRRPRRAAIGCAQEDAAVPAAKRLLASNDSESTGRAVVPTSVHELAPSTVRYSFPSLVAATPTVSLRDTASTGRAGPFCARVPGSGLRWANVSPFVVGAQHRCRP
jgi:hypothetical protein